MKKESFLRVLAIMKKLRVEYARLHPLAFWNYYRDFNVRWMFRDVRRVIVMAYHACQPQAASQPQVAALASKPQAASLGCLQDEEEAEWKKRRRERRKRRRTLSNHRSGASEMRRRIWAYGQRVVLRTHLSTASLGCIQDEEEAEWKKPVCYTVWMTGILHYRDTSWCSGQRCC